MKRIKNGIVILLSIASILYVLMCTLLYFYQEKIIFFPTKLVANFKYNMTQEFEEIFILTKDKTKLNALLIKADSSKGVVFYLHGNAGALDTWNEIAKTYTDLHYDICILDYRSFGKSEGKIEDEQQFYDDIQTAYDTLKNRYAENKIVVIGYSIGTGSAAMIASKNNPKQLILQAPYYSLTDMMQHTYSFVPSFLLKYKFKTFEFIQHTKCPIAIFHGNADEVIYYGSSLKLKAFLKPIDNLISLENQGHNGMNENLDYQKKLKEILK